MLGDNDSNAAGQQFLAKHFQYPASVSNQLQFCRNMPREFHGDPLIYHGNNHGTPLLPPNKGGGDAKVIPGQQKLHFSLNNKACPDEANRNASMLIQNPVSTGLRLSYDEDERNSSITSASGSLMAVSSVFPSLSNAIRRQLDQQKEELDHFIRTQEESMVRGMRDMKQRHMASFLAALEKDVGKKLREKDLELEMMTRKNKELVESMKQVTAEAQNWCFTAKYNESVVNVLKTNLQQAMQDSHRAKEGFGENDIDDAASYIDPNDRLGRSALEKKNMICRICKAKEVSILLMPCKHLCLCKGCESFSSVCPVCQMVTTGGFEVYLG